MTNIQQEFKMEDFDNIYIIDDEYETAEMIEEQVNDLGYDSKIISNVSFDSPEEIISTLDTSHSAVLCDNRLSFGRLASFPGAELVSKLYRIKMPALLLTEFSSMDIDTSIREFRQYIPILIKRSDLNPEIISYGISKCIDEINGKFVKERKSYRSMIQIQSITVEGSYEVIDGFIPSWRSQEAIRFPSSLIKREVLDYIKSSLDTASGSRVSVIAHVNIGARTGEEIFLSNFSLPPRNSNEIFDSAIIR